MVYTRNSITSGISVVKNVHDKIIWLKLDKSFFNNNEDIFIAAVYIWGSDFPMANLIDTDLFESLGNDINHFQSLGTVMSAVDYTLEHRVKVMLLFLMHIYTILTQTSI